MKKNNLILIALYPFYIPRKAMDDTYVHFYISRKAINSPRIHFDILRKAINSPRICFDIPCKAMEGACIGLDGQGIDFVPL